MDSKMNKPQTILSRRKFLTVAGIATSISLAPKRILAAGENEFDMSSVKKPGTNIYPVNNIAEIIEQKTICIEPGKFPGTGTEYGLDANGHIVIKKNVMEPNRYLGWPTILKTDKDRLMVSFSGDRDSHICPYGKTQMIISDDNGKTWSTPEIINNTPLDDRDSGLIQTPKGTLVISWFTSLVFESPAHTSTYFKYARIGEKISAASKKQWLGNWVRRSEDAGKTWLEPSRTASTAPHGPIALRNGDLLYIGTAALKGKPSIIAEKSFDDGRTWQVIGEIPRPDNLVSSLSEPHVVELKSGKLLAMIRNEPKDVSQCFLLQSESLDNGKTWSTMKSTGIWGYPPHLTQLHNGWVLVAYGCRKEPYGERACISKDEGATWQYQDEINLCNAESRDLGYPSSVQLNDGSIITAYYQAPKLGEPACLMSTHWKLK